MLVNLRSKLPVPRPVSVMDRSVGGPSSFRLQNRKFDVAEQANGFLRERYDLYLPYKGGSSLSFDRRTGYLPYSEFPVTGAFVIKDNGLAVALVLVEDPKKPEVKRPEFMRISSGLPRDVRAAMEKYVSEGNTVELKVHTDEAGKPATGNWISFMMGDSVDGKKAGLIQLAEVFILNGIPFRAVKEITVNMEIKGSIRTGMISPDSTEVFLDTPGNSTDSFMNIQRLEMDEQEYFMGGQVPLRIRVNWPVGIMGLTTRHFIEGVHSLTLPSIKDDGTFTSTGQRVLYGRGIFDPALEGSSLILT